MNRLNMPLHIFLLIFASLTGLSVFADQYQSNELIESKTQNAKAIKSISELEAELNGLTDDYAKDSTARYLARHYAQKNTKESVAKAIEYYQLSLKGKGLSVYAQQATMLELLALFYQHQMHQAFISAVDQYVELKGVPDTQLNIKTMLVHYHMNHKNKSLLMANKLLKYHEDNDLALEVSDLNQLLFTFYNLQDYLKSARIQQYIIAIEDNDLEQWLRLSKLHIKNNKPEQASEVLLLALQKGMTMEQDDLILICDLLSQSGNPYFAARLMQQLVDEYKVDHNLENFDRLFTYWYLSQELERAALAKRKSLIYESSTARSLDLAELYYQMQQWDNMNLTIKDACSFPLKDEFVSRANLLLGISELKLKREAQAIEAFYNATMISGKVKEAVAYLNYLNVDISDTRRYEQITGVCAPELVKF